MQSKYDHYFDGNWHSIEKPDTDSWARFRRRLNAAASRRGLAIESRLRANGSGEILRFRTLTCPPPLADSDG